MHDSRIVLAEMSHPGDADVLRRLLDSGEFRAEDVQGVMLTHEGDLVANAYSAYVYAATLGSRLGRSIEDVFDNFPIQAMAGAVGFMTPHAAIFVRTNAPNRTPGNGGKRLAVAGTCTRAFHAEEIGSAAYIREVQDQVEALIEELQVDDPADVHLVFAKCPWPAARHIRDAQARGQTMPSNDFWVLGELARGGAALGVGLALGEIADDGAPEKLLREHPEAYSTVAHCSSTEDRRTVALIMVANSPASVSEVVCGHGVLQDGLDTDGVKQVMRSVGLQFDCCPSREQQERIVYSFLKPKTSETRELRGHRHTLREHPTVGYMWWMIEKAPVHAMVASVLGNPVMEVATGAEHQGPVGQPLLTLVARA